MHRSILITVRPLPFWKSDPLVWFDQIEAQFSLNGITKDSTKYDVSAVDTEIISQVSDIVQAPPKDNKYQTLKDRLINTYTNSDEKKLQKLLIEIELGDRKPSTLKWENRTIS